MDHDENLEIELDQSNERHCLACGDELRKTPHLICIECLGEKADKFLKATNTKK